MNNLKTIRRKRKYTQVKVAMYLGLTQETVSAYENDHSFPSLDTLSKLADFLNTSTDYILSRTDDDRPINFDKDKLSSDEIELLLNYKKLSPDDKTKLSGYMDALLSIGVL